MLKYFENPEVNRKILHITFGICLAISCKISKDITNILLAILAICILSFDIICKKFVTNINFKKKLYRASELGTARKTTGATWFGLGIACILPFGCDVYLVPMLILAFCDSLSSLIGRRYGKKKLFSTSRSLEGFLAFVSGFVFVAPMALFAGCFLSLSAIFLCVFFCAICELWESVDDNFSILLGGSLLAYLLQ
jgi:dolichol kinase